jgi:hypothetical protein
LGLFKSFLAFRKSFVRLCYDINIIIIIMISLSVLLLPRRVKCANVWACVFKRLGSRLCVVVQSCKPSTQEAEAGECSFEASLGHIVRPYLQKNPKKQNPKKVGSKGKLFFFSKVKLFRNLRAGWVFS